MNILINHFASGKRTLNMIGGDDDGDDGDEEEKEKCCICKYRLDFND